MKTLQQHWADYMQHVMPAGASDIQINEGKLCFFSGANSMFAAMTVDVAAMGDRQAMQAMQKLTDELAKFATEFAATGKVP